MADADILGPALAEAHLLDGYPLMEEHANAEWLFGGDVEKAWIAELGGNPVGHVSVVQPFDAPGLSGAVGAGYTRTLGLSRLFVAPAGRGRGTASALIACVEQYAAGVGAPLALEVIEHNAAAIALYERRGWSRINTYEASWFGENGPHPIAHLYLAPTRSTP
ncbi:MAG: family N-acetyltransferase [Microbacteriaceae bacterium]|nr:family N-acetyltransferase [Microbacteriaceae bacterium]